MPAIAPRSKVLVTGANGYIAVWVVRRLLEQGYVVRGTVRSAAKGEHVKKLFGEYGAKFEVVVVEDIGKDGAFDDAVKGIDAIEHVASPFHYNAQDPSDFIQPAVKGTTGILQSALKYGSDVRRVVITSSTAAVMDPFDAPKVFTEADWAQKPIDDVERDGKSAPKFSWYRASKTLAEKAAWEFVRKNKESMKWDLVTLNPPYVYGPTIHEISSPDELNTSQADLYTTLLKGKDEQALATQGGSWIDVRDLARAHVLALEKEAASWERIIVSAGPFKFQDFVDAANAVGVYPADRLTKGVPGAGKKPDVVHMIQYDNSKAKRVLGIDEYISMEECVKDSLEDFKRRGW